MAERLPAPTITTTERGRPELHSGFIPLLQLFERLALLGYSFDLAKWETLVNAGLLTGVPPMPSNDCQIPHALEARIRSILDVEKKLPPGVEVEKLAFYLVISGLAGVPTSLIGAYVESSFSKFFIVGDGMLRRLERKPLRIGAFGERRLAEAMANTLLRDYPLLGASSYVACTQLLATAFTIYFRTTWENRKPSPRRQWQQIITPEFLDWTRLPVKTIGEPPTPPDTTPVQTLTPAVDRDRIFMQFRSACATNPQDVQQAVCDSALVITSAAAQFPELQDCQPMPNPKSAFAHWVLTLITPILAAGLYRVSQRTGAERYANLIPDRKETGLESILRTVLIYWHT